MHLSRGRVVTISMLGGAHEHLQDGAHCIVASLAQHISSLTQCLAHPPKMCSPSPQKSLDEVMSSMKIATNRPSWMTSSQQRKVATNNIWTQTKFASSSADSPSSPTRARLSWMQDDSGEHCAGGAGGASQDGISVLDELCMWSQVYDDMGCGSMQLALIGDGCP